MDYTLKCRDYDLIISDLGKARHLATLNSMLEEQGSIDYLLQMGSYADQCYTSAVTAAFPDWRDYCPNLGGGYAS